MIYVAILLSSLCYTSSPMTIYDFTEDSDISRWNIVNDVVMGGRSTAVMSIDTDGNGVFRGVVSLDNNGGFCSVRYGMDQVDVSSYSKVIISIKGDGKNYQFRVKSHYRERHAYISSFQTTGDWQSLEINLKKMIPTFRGRKLSMANYPKEYLSEIRFLIGNKKPENFKLVIDSIHLE
ncbi:MAG: NADH dehydrogenase [ubiquinone] 1 alpha subcomplex assembly factor 1 [Saprospiraceae bacterium]|jgi:NADH dehydrogenase [ubiquinone] 1 alpha subcomplex assembly factor 1